MCLPHMTSVSLSLYTYKYICWVVVIVSFSRVKEARSNHYYWPADWMVYCKWLNRVTIATTIKSGENLKYDPCKSNLHTIQNNMYADAKCSIDMMITSCDCSIYFSSYFVWNSVICDLWFNTRFSIVFVFFFVFSWLVWSESHH